MTGMWWLRAAAAAITVYKMGCVKEASHAAMDPPLGADDAAGICARHDLLGRRSSDCGQLASRINAHAARVAPKRNYAADFAIRSRRRLKSVGIDRRRAHLVSRGRSQGTNFLLRLFAFRRRDHLQQPSFG